MYGFKSKAQREREQSLAGGMIEGPGTGTSDSIKAKIPRGSYIMPADSTEKIGPDQLSGMGARGFHPKGEMVDARVSNGEYEMPPEQVHAVGVQTLNQMKDATHTPEAQGFQSKTAATVESGELYFADGGAVESTDEMIARISAKYGTGAAPAPSPQPAPQAPRPAQPQDRGATVASAADALRGRRRQIDEAAGYADGGLVDEEEQTRTVAGAPGVQRTGNSYSDAPAAPSPAQSATASPAPGGLPKRTPTFGETQDRINDQRAERTGTGLYGAPRDPAQREQSGPGFLDRAAPNTMTAIRGAGDDIAESYKVGGLPAAAGSVVRNTMVPAIGFAADVASGAKTLLDPAANALKTVVTGDPTPIGQSPSLAGANAASTNPAATTTRKRLGTPNGSPPGAPIAGTSFDEWQSGATRQQRDTAGDAYRNAWQQQAPGGLRRAGADATTLYNAEQQVRGTGVTAQRDANGRMSFSGNGANALPQSYTSGVDLNASNASLAAANKIRQDYLDSQAAADGGTKGGVIENSGPAETNAQFRASRQNDLIRNAINSGNPKMVEAVARGIGTMAGRDNAEAHLAADERNAAAGFAREDRNQNYRNRELALRGQELGFRSQAERDRLALDQRRADADLQAQGFQTRAAERLEALQSQFEKAGTPEERAQLAEQIRVLSGREAPNRYTVVPGGQEWDAQAGVMRTNPSRVLNNQTGRFVDQPAATAQPAAPVDPAKFIKGKIYTDANGNRGIFDGTTFVPVS